VYINSEAGHTNHTLHHTHTTQHTHYSYTLQQVIGAAGPVGDRNKFTEYIQKNLALYRCVCV
jgi:hypothetical protein